MSACRETVFLENSSKQQTVESTSKEKTSFVYQLLNDFGEQHYANLLNCSVYK